MPPENILEQSTAGVFTALCDLLADPSTDVKVAAGEALAFLWEIADGPGNEPDPIVSGALIWERPPDVRQAIGMICAYTMII
jgi:hypothetical protein